MAKPRVAITGIRGQLGSALQRQQFNHWDIFGSTSDEVDIANWPQVRDWIAFARPDLVIHAAANTDVDGCEREPAAAYRVNAVGTHYVAQAAASVGAQLVYVSTNFVFDGAMERPYHEFDSPAPISAYGASKLAGENEALRATADCYVIRTAMVYAREGRNFVNSMLRLFADRDQLSVVNDQSGNPTFADDLAVGIVRLIETGPPGIYHMTNSGAASWFEWADEIRRISGSKVHLTPILAAEYRRDASPPSNGILESVFLPDLGISLPDWRDALRRCLSQ